MTPGHDDDHTRRDHKEPSLKDALMPAKPNKPSRPGRSRKPAPSQRAARRDTYGETPSLKDALLPENHVPNPPAAQNPPRVESQPAETQIVDDWRERPRQAGDWSARVIPGIVAAAIVLGFVVVFFLGRMSSGRDAATSTPEEPAAVTADPTPVAASPEAPAAPAPRGEPLTDWRDPGPMSLADMREQRRIVDVHEHIESLEEAPMFLAAMDRFGIEKACLMGSSDFTLTLNEEKGFTGYDENNEELIKIIEAYPGRFEAWPTLSPTDPDKLAKIQALVARGATGVKLYTGHGYVTRKHEYIFHPVALDDPGMLPFYAWCEDNYIPIAMHVNPFKDKKGFAEEFIAVLTQFPDMKVIAPHFILSSVKSSRLEEYLDTFPNLYTDISFGDFFMKERLTYISKYPKKFRRIFEKYPDRFMFAADLVMIKNRKEDWAPTQYQAYIDMLTKEKYTSPAIPNVELNGLNLSEDLVSRILFRNYQAFRAYRPVGTKITRAIDWSRMNVEPVDRKPGEAFPPAPKAQGDAGE